MSIPELESVEGAGPKLLQMARSTPGLIASLVGHKIKEHVVANVALSNVQPLSHEDFLSAMTGLAR